jgi:TonB family protein
MRFIIYCFLLIAYSNVNAQAKITKYYNAVWAETSKDKAAFYADFIKNGAGYSCTSYWINTITLRGRSNFPDTVMANADGLQLLYFKNGHVEDSIFYENNKVQYAFHFYPGNKLAMHYYIPAGSTGGVVEGFDEDGKKIKHYIYQKEAEFKGGVKAWQSYIVKSVDKSIYAKGDNAVTARVEVEFIIDESGDVSSAKIYKSSGLKNVDNDALRIINESPKWNTAILYNQPVRAFRVQPLEYQLQPQKK